MHNWFQQDFNIFIFPFNQQELPPSSGLLLYISGDGECKEKTEKQASGKWLT